MRCEICNSDTDSVSFSNGKFSPCTSCQEVISDCLRSYEDIEVEEGEEELVEDGFDVGC